MSLDERDLRSVLEQELVERCRKNPKYSIRAFSRSLGVESSTLSKILSGKRVISQSMHLKLGKSLGLPSHEIKKFHSYPLEKRGRKRMGAYPSLSLPLFSIISDWFHYGILELFKTKGFHPEPKFIAKRLNLRPTQAKDGLSRLQRAGLLKKKGKEWILSSDSTSGPGSNSGKTSVPQRKLQRQILLQSLEALKEIPIEKRSHTSITMAIDSKRLPEARLLIQEFRKKLCEKLQSTNSLDEVYQLSVSLFPVSQTEKPFSKGENQ